LGVGFAEFMKQSMHSLFFLGLYTFALIISGLGLSLKQDLQPVPFIMIYLNILIYLKIQNGLGITEESPIQILEAGAISLQHLSVLLLNFGLIPLVD
tara:strand:+ start:467 stop:757 length:291 start_codon:yes stop_codon:yes gene_type:complete